MSGRLIWPCCWVTGDHVCKIYTSWRCSHVRRSANQQEFDDLSRCSLDWGSFICFIGLGATRGAGSRGSTKPIRNLFAPRRCTLHAGRPHGAGVRRVGVRREQRPHRCRNCLPLRRPLGAGGRAMGRGADYGSALLSRRRRQLHQSAGRERLRRRPGRRRAVDIPSGNGSGHLARWHMGDSLPTLGIDPGHQQFRSGCRPPRPRSNSVGFRVAGR